MCELDKAFAARVLAYEVGMLVRAPEYECRARACGDDPGANLALESALLHARSLYEFFYMKARSHDITRRDFVDSWKPGKELTPCYVKKHRDRISKMLAHLTRARLEYIRAGEYEWNLVRIRWELLRVFFAFLEVSPRDIASIIEGDLRSRFDVSLAGLKAMPQPPK